ncbi:MAG: hypothetical protein HYZ14_12245 [Bacteroidetes bacterium]|nr:hypothetical protein [Bacteroidota bacterium]
MSESEKRYLEIGRSIKGAEESQMFGKPCFKVKGKAFMSLFNGCCVFKLQGDQHADALSLDGAAAFDPSGKGRAMKEWVQLPVAYAKKWPGFAKAAFNYVAASA